MGLRWGGSAGAPGPGGAGAGASLIYAAFLTETTLSGNHEAGSTDLTLASVEGVLDTFSLGVSVAAAALETHAFAFSRLKPVGEARYAAASAECGLHRLHLLQRFGGLDHREGDHGVVRLRDVVPP